MLNKFQEINKLNKQKKIYHIKFRNVCTAAPAAKC